MIYRSYYQIIKSRIEEPRRFIQVVFGPRQVGKTTMVKQLFDHLSTPTILASADAIVGDGSVWVRDIWQQARSKSKDGGEVVLAIDEVQKIKSWSELVKREWDNDTLNSRNIKVILLGSSSLQIQKGFTESLAGRFEKIYIPHWSYSEMKEAFGFSLDQYVWFGGYPGAASLISDEQRWKQYVNDSLIETSVNRDILMLTTVEKPALMRRLFDIGAHYSSQILSLTKIQGELNEKGNITTLSNYLSLLDNAGLLCGLDKFAFDVIRQRASKPKFQVYNNALMSAVSELSFSMAHSDKSAWGRWVESAVGTHLVNHSFGERYQVNYWNENSNEVDYVITKGSRYAGIEVKSGKNTVNHGMEIFNAKFNPYAMITVGAETFSLEDFLLMNPVELLS